MGYPAVVDQLLDRFALRHPEQRDAYANQIVDLVSGALVRSAGGVPEDQLKAEIEAALDLFAGGAFLSPAAVEQPQPKSA